MLEKRPTELFEYIFREIMPKEHYSIRESQIALSKNIYSALKQGNTALCEAEVGTGKTHAYIIAALIYKYYYMQDLKPITIATASISLQKSIVEDYIPAISNILTKYGILDKPIEVTVRKGKEHYICDMRLKNFLDNTGNIDDSIIPILENLKDNSWRNIDLANVNGLNEYIRKRISVRGSCLKALCSNYGKCRYSQLKEYFESDDIDIQITNHNYYIADAIHRNEGAQPLLQQSCLVIFDEAHLLIDAARSMYSKSVKWNTVERIAESIEELHTDNVVLSRELYDMATILKESNNRLFNRLTSKIYIDAEDEAERFPTEVNNATTKNLMFSMAGILDRLADKIDASKEIDDRTLPKARQAANMSRITANVIRFLLKAEENIYWVEFSRAVIYDYRNAMLFAMPINVPEYLYNCIWSTDIPKILTSGTLSIGGDFTHIKKVTGIDIIPPYNIQESSFESPYNFNKNTMIYFSTKTRFPNFKDENYINSIADEIERLICATHGHTLVLFTSYKVMDLVYEVIKDKIAYPLFIMHKGDYQALKKYRISKNGVLLAGGACFEGIDIPGDILSSLIIVKLPFPVPDPIQEYEKSLYDSDIIFKKKAIVPQMQIKIKQGTGRLIRTETDKGVISILDSRCRPGSKYYYDVMNAVHTGRVTTKITEIEKFLRQIKSDEYFMRF